MNLEGEMTRINKVVLTGFKSFRKQTVIPFFNGLTAIIGENGSGKSNLFDAINFVMGRRSSQLRSDRLEHLIFNGGERYPPEDSAEVVLHLDNADGLFTHFLQNGNSPPEITLGRRITRHSSTYTFMGKTCPRGQIDEILQSGRIDPDGQQLIAQGRITEVIRKGPIKRREIIDEISGIAAYDDKKRKAIVELKEVKSKLNTHRIILAERRRRLRSLAEEKDAALEHQRITEEQKLLERSIAHRKRERIIEKLERAKEERSEMAERVQTLEEAVAKLDLEVENKEWELDEIQDDLKSDNRFALVKEVERIRSEILNKRSEINLKHQQVKNIQEMIDEVVKIKAAEAARSTTSSPSGNRAVQALLQRKQGGVYGTISSLASMKPGFETAFETAAGGHLNDVVVDSRETAIACINYLKSKRLGRARILPMRRIVAPRKSLSSADALKLEGAIDYAINLVEFDQKYRRAFEYVLSDTIVVESLEVLKDVDGVRAVTVDGDLQSKGGAMTGGWRPGAGKKHAEPKDAGFDTAKKRQQISHLQKEIDKLEEEIEEKEALLQEKERELDKLEKEENRVKGSATSRSDELHALREKRREAYQQMENLRRGLSRYERQEAEAQAELESIGEEKADSTSLIEGSLSELTKRIEKNERALRRLEPVNMRAIEEHAAYEREFNLFRERVDALEAEKHEIELLIGQIEERKKERFLETFNEVEAQFDRIFKLLFQGGGATLELEEEGNISSGLLIKANPPEKEPHMIDSLSGGEQSLVAMAFICALQEYQKAPFFILDEIDAALDLLNATRLSKMLADYASRIQVIVVSHNEETVRHAERAYGVTMKNGVSQVLALNLN